MLNNFYFAYGSNMNEEQMQKRCPNAKPIGKAILKDHKIAFTRESNKWKCAVADILVSPGDNVWGVLYSITEEDLSNLDKHEGVAVNAYKRIELQVELYRISDQFFIDISSAWNDDKERDEINTKLESEYIYYEKKQAYTYEVVKKRLDLHPSTEYLDVLLDAAFEYHFPGEYIEEVSGYGKHDVQIKSSAAIEYLLLLREFVLNNNWPKEVSNEPEWGGAELVITGDLNRKKELAINYPEDLVILSPHWKKLSWLVRNIYHHPSMHWQTNYYNKYAILNALGTSMADYQKNNPDDREAEGICEALIVRAYEILTH
jgi:hypothetical protein